jgi:hypothetical protein
MSYVLCLNSLFKRSVCAANIFVSQYYLNNEQSLLFDAKRTEICLLFFKLWHSNNAINESYDYVHTCIDKYTHSSPHMHD